MCVYTYIYCTYTSLLFVSCITNIHLLMPILANQGKKINNPLWRNHRCSDNVVLFFLLWRKELGVFATRLLVLISVITNMLYLWSRCVSPGTSKLCHMQVNLTTTLRRATEKESSVLVASILHTTITDTMPVNVVFESNSNHTENCPIQEPHHSPNRSEAWDLYSIQTLEGSCPEFL